MWAIFHRAILPLVLILSGTGLLVRGARYHAVPVTGTEIVEVMVEEEREETIRVPSAFGPPPSPDGQAGPGDPLGPQPGGLPFVPSPFEPPPIKIKRLVEVPRKVPKAFTHDVSEAELVADVTMGRVELRAPGEVWRTYVLGEDGQPPPPSLCPT
jgi:hypothetical protein